MNIATRMINWPDGRKYVVRYLRFAAGSFKRSTAISIQFSRLEFLTKDGTYFDYPPGTQVSISSARPFSGQGPEKVIDHSVDTKVCASSPSFPWKLTVDLGEGNGIDVGKFSRWEWWTADDCPDRDPHLVSLELSVDGANWVQVDSSDVAVTETRKTLAYRGEIDRTPLHGVSRGGGGGHLCLNSSKRSWARSRASGAHSRRRARKEAA